MSAQRTSWSPYTEGTASEAGQPQPQLDSGPVLNLLPLFIAPHPETGKYIKSHHESG